MKQVILIKLGELFLKGLNRSAFENVLMENIKNRVKKFGTFELLNAESVFFLFSQNKEINLEIVLKEIKNIFGISNFCLAYVAKKDIKDISEVALRSLKPHLLSASNFKVECKRSDKNFPMKSPQVSSTLGGCIIKEYKHLYVNLDNPEVIVNVEIRKNYAFIYNKIYKGAGGMPVGTSSKATVLISGGIDSPVAAWMMAKRGANMAAVHFSTPPYTSQRSEDKVFRVLEKVANYSDRVELHVVKFTKIQEEINKKCPEEFSTIISRRMMMKISEKIANICGSKALVTGESLGQVASQTMDSLVCTDAAASLPVFRPLIGMDKCEIINIAKKIKTFDISTEPFEDCCSIFTPKHPQTHPSLEKILDNEK
ncbi:MAG: tRNA 4-thiouridine(8) synthase ThiI, partial [Oscillospiraceae bacterium]|nr:tRNA 4-thiouridine(8) synthase ThiI [Oscillospiraceae bacterium]